MLTGWDLFEQIQVEGLHFFKDSVNILGGGGEEKISHQPVMVPYIKLRTSSGKLGIIPFMVSGPGIGVITTKSRQIIKVIKEVQNHHNEMNSNNNTGDLTRMHSSIHKLLKAAN